MRPDSNHLMLPCLSPVNSDHRGFGELLSINGPTITRLAGGAIAKEGTEQR